MTYISSCIMDDKSMLFSFDVRNTLFLFTRVNLMQFC